jgi:glucose-1-phosphate adenylyltransferase
MTDSFVGKDTYISQSILGENVKVGDRVKMGIGENVPNELKPSIYNSGITVVGDRACIPDDCNIGKNVVIDIGINKDEICSLNIESGKSALKGGECE